jgi:hypothetical protein
VGEGQILYSAANRTSSKQDKQQTGQAANRTSSKQDKQQTGQAANRTTSVSNPSHLTAMTIGLLGLDRLRRPFSQKSSGKSMECCSRFVNHTLFKKCEDCAPRIKQIPRNRKTRNFKILKTEFPLPRTEFVVAPFFVAETTSRLSP